MTTLPNEIWSLGRNTDVTQDLHNFLGVENDSSLFHPKQLRERLDALDDLDIRFGDFTAARYLNDPDARIANLAKAMRARPEAVNTALYESISSEIVRGAPPQILLKWIQAPASREETASGFGYDYRDEAVTGILQLREPSEPRLHPVPEMVFYQPTPVPIFSIF